VDLSNRTLALFGTFTAVLAVLAIVVTLRVDVSSAPSDAADQGVSVRPVVTRTGGTDVEPKGPLVVRLGSGRSSTARLTCELFRSQRPFERGAVTFPTVPLGECSILLEGTTTSYSPVFPGDTLTCGIAGDATECTGGLAASRAARVEVTSDRAGMAYIDDVAVGPVPVSHEVKIGRRALKVAFDDGTYASWSLVVLPDQAITVHFPESNADLPEGLPERPPVEPAPVASPRRPPRPRPAEPASGTPVPAIVPEPADLVPPVADVPQLPPAVDEEEPPPGSTLLAPR
jgi:hypothetical protein